MKKRSRTRRRRRRHLGNTRRFQIFWWWGPTLCGWAVNNNTDLCAASCCSTGSTPAALQAPPLTWMFPTLNESDPTTCCCFTNTNYTTCQDDINPTSVWKPDPPAECPPPSHMTAVFPVWCLGTSSAWWSTGSSSGLRRSHGSDPGQSPGGPSGARSPSPWLPTVEGKRRNSGESENKGDKEKTRPHTWDHIQMF